STGANFGRARNAPSTPELPLHSRAHVFHWHFLERTSAKLRGGDDHMVDRAALPEKLANALVACDIGRNRFRAQLHRSLLQTVGVTRCNDDISALIFCKFGCR